MYTQTRHRYTPMLTIQSSNKYCKSDGTTWNNQTDIKIIKKTILYQNKQLYLLSDCFTCATFGGVGNVGALNIPCLCPCVLGIFLFSRLFKCVRLRFLNDWALKDNQSCVQTPPDDKSGVTEFFFFHYNADSWQHVNMSITVPN